MKINELCRADMGSVIHEKVIEVTPRPLSTFPFERIVPKCGAQNRARYTPQYMDVDEEYLFTHNWCAKCFPDGRPLVDDMPVDPSLLQRIEALDTGEKKHLIATEKTYFCGRRRGAPSWYKHIDQDNILSKVQLCRACDKSYDLARDRGRRRIWAWLMKTG